MSASARGHSALWRWWLLTRPAGLWLPPLLPLLGYGWAHWDRALLAYHPEALLPVLLAWVALQAGTLWLNAARDRDQGEVLLGQAVTVPPGTSLLGYAGLAVAVLLAVIAGVVPGLCALGAAALAVLYSHPATAWKGHPVLGPAVNLVGYGILSPVAGYAVVGAPPTWRSLATLAILAVAVLGWTFISQAFQQDEDRSRGDRTLVATHGPRIALTAGRICLGTAAAILSILVLAGWYPAEVALALVGALLTDRALRRWARELTGGERRARRVLVLGVLTLALAVGGALIDYGIDSATGGPVAGLATRAGMPSDRIARPAAEQIVRDVRHRELTGASYRPN